MGFSRLGRDATHRWSMLRTMVTQLVEHERLETTLPRAKELRRLADRMVTLGKEGTLAARRSAAAVLCRQDMLSKLFGPLAERYRARAGGYSRVLQTRNRRGDNAPMAFIEYVDRPGELRPARPGGKPAPSLLPPAAAAAAAAVGNAP